MGYHRTYKLYSAESTIIRPRPLNFYTSAKKDNGIVSIKDAFELYVRNVSLREILDTGAFCYAENYFTLRNEKYVILKNDAYFLTDYAKSHLHECTLKFSYKLLKLNSDFVSEKYLLRSNLNNYKQVSTFNANIPQNAELYNTALAQIKSKFFCEFNRIQAMDETTSQKMWRYMELQNWNTRIFQEKTLLNPIDYSRLKNNHKFDIKSYTAMAVGLGLTISETENALQLSGLCYDEHNNTDFAYKFILTNFNGYSIDKCNEILIELNIQPLGRKTKKSKNFVDG